MGPSAVHLVPRSVGGLAANEVLPKEKEGKGKKTATVATARKLLTVIYHMLKQREKIRLEG
ncbi:hypothetical protein AKJ45_03595 [candidate division MSBL1 archaeon SCGC-AAA261F19]|uniref:Uncharacterized protein n=1 Tax=candidate division MSBL1 archaeon SCGC-AAA261F19 TaxID=1698275 RepID=A0A133V7A9_9EURY|nr:hypothetical protein AKJ45_03595 [candidate division MSBL1 archaeon SCGC-AAA261F19]